ncbi:MAG: repeat protein [Glaciihabitans sp.]|nr:repeat protein [Glaciihabitans sp.]
MAADDFTVPLDASPADRIAVAVERYGEQEVAVKAASLLLGANEGEEFLLFVGGVHARGVLDGAPVLYWPELWGARALMYAWDASAATAIEQGLSNQSWRVREMSAKVVALRKLAYAQKLNELLEDSVPRVRAQAARALGYVGGSEQVDAVTALLRDPDIDVRRRAGEALTMLGERPDRAAD